MDPQRKSLRVGLIAIAAALILRVFTFTTLEPWIELLLSPRVVAFLIYTETGRDLRQAREDTVVIHESFPEPEICYPSESPPAQPPPLPVFTDPDLVDMTWLSPCPADIPGLLARPLDWNLRAEEPTVLIVHTHTTESYEKNGADYTESAPYRTVDPRYNVLAVGEHVARLLEAGGIRTIHDREFHDYPDYNGCYGRTRQCIARHLREYPGLCLILDLHRDANDGRNGQLRTLARVGEQDSAQLMLVVGSPGSGQPPWPWKHNLSLGLKLQAQLQSQCPGIVRPLSFRSQRFNQDLCPGFLLIEVGGAGNSLREAQLAAEQLARAILALAGGTGEPAALPSGPSEASG